jgi:CubicO group peptidase (beta-lactamase class C family)
MSLHFRNGIVMEIASLSRGLPSTYGVDAASISAFLEAAADIELHGLMIYRDGAVVAEGYWRPYAAHRPHMLHSAVKSWTATAVSLAVGDGLLSLDDRVLGFFPEHRPAEVSDNLQAMTVRDLLTMRSGHLTGISGGEWRGTSESWVAAFLREPVPHVPGTAFIYNSGSSYVLSAIVTKATGRTAYALMKDRVFRPLGIESITWDISPEGFSTGGNGLSCTLEDVVKFGVLYLQDGVWQGQRLLPAGWVAEATRNHVDDAWLAQLDGRRYPARDQIPESAIERRDGYGYHWWMTPDGGYRATGLFGQQCIVLPHLNAVIGLTAALQLGQSRIMPLIWQYLMPALRATGTSRAADDALAENLRALALPLPSGRTESPTAAQISGRFYAMDPNEDDVSAVRFDLEDGVCSFTLVDERGLHRIDAGFSEPIESDTTMTGFKLHHQYQPAMMRVVASATWLETGCLCLTWRFVETAFCDTLICTFEGAALQLARRVNTNPGGTERPIIIGRIQDV